MLGNRALPPPPGLDDLARNAPVALFLDFDGTLVGIAATPGGIYVPDGLGKALRDLAGRLGGRLALVSGRAITDLEAHIGPLGVARAGSHGIDRQHADGRALDSIPQALPQDARTELRTFAEARGFDLEDKPHGAALHYRSDPSLEQAGLDFANGLADRCGLELKRGKCVIELVRPGADKGGAVRAFMNQPAFAGSCPYFIGDDVTDEDGFIAVGEFGGAGILVGDRDNTQAHYRLPDPPAVLDWLSLNLDGAA